MRSKTLPNGLRVIVDPSHSSRVAAVQVWVRTGSADETPEEAGLAHVHEHMLFKGTARRGVGEIAGAIEGAGGDINAYTSFDQTVYHVTIASREVELALDVLADAVQHSAFDETELARELEVVLEELRRGQDSPGRRVSELLFGQVFKVHSYGRPIIGYVDTVESFTRDRILAFYRRWYRPSNMLLVVTGDVDPDAILAQAERCFDRGEPSPLPARPRSAEPPQDGLRFAEQAMDVQETQLQVAWPGPALSHADTPALDVLSVLLGTGESSRLYRRVRRDAELVTDCYAYTYTPHDPGLVGLGAQIQDKSVPEVLKALLREAFDLHYRPPHPSEVEKARTIVLSEAVYGMQTVQGQARKLGYFELVAGGIEFEAAYREAIAKVTPADVQRVAEAWLLPERLTVSVVRPEAGEAVLTENQAQQAVDQAFEAARQGPLVAGAELAEVTVGEAVAADLGEASPAIKSLALGVSSARLSNGMTVLVQPDDKVPLVSLLATAQGGLLAENERTAGVSHLVAELLVRGTRRFSAEEIAASCDAMAGGVSGQSGRNSLGVRGEFLRESWPRGLDLFASCLTEPTFEEKELERERRTALEDLASRSDSPGAVAFDALMAHLYGAHPYARSVLGTADSVRGLSRSDVQAAYHAQLRPELMTVAVVGDVDPNETIRRLERALGHFRAPADSAPFLRPAAPEPLAALRQSMLPREKAQTQLMFGFSGLSMEDERRFALEVLSQILGGQSGRLFLELRDRHSLAYSVGAFNLEGLDPGYFGVHIGTHPSKVETAERMLLQELKRLLETVPSEAEISRAQRYLVGSYEIGLQRASARSSSMALNHIYGLGHDAHSRHAAAIEAVTAEDVREVARHIIRLEHRARVEVGPENALAVAG